MAKRNFQRIVLKLSGEALAGDQGFGINPDVVEEFAQEIAAVSYTHLDVYKRQPLSISS